MNPSTKQKGKGRDLPGRRTISVKTCCHTRWLYWLAALESRGLGSNSSSVFLNKFIDLSDHLFLYTKENLLPNKLYEVNFKHPNFKLDKCEKSSILELIKYSNLFNLVKAMISMKYKFGWFSIYFF